MAEHPEGLVTQPARHPKRPTDEPGRPGRPLSIVVRTLAGHHLDERVCAGERVHEVAADAVAQFVARGELLAGRYVLTLPRLEASAEIDQRARINEVGIREGDVLVLISATPQVDGAGTTLRGPSRAAR